MAAKQRSTLRLPAENLPDLSRLEFGKAEALLAFARLSVLGLISAAAPLPRDPRFFWVAPAHINVPVPFSRSAHLPHPALQLLGLLPRSKRQILPPTLLPSSSRPFGWGSSATRARQTLGNPFSASAVLSCTVEKSAGALLSLFLAPVTVLKKTWCP